MSDRASSRHRVLNGMTVDVEEHFQVSAFAPLVRRADWDAHPSRVVPNTGRVLDLLDEHEVRATFFVLGWIGERFPGLVRQLADRGHEVSCHGYSHRLAYEQQRDEFRQETQRARQVLQDATGQPVLGYRAASFSIDRRNPWALDVLAETGFAYDSSLFPIRHDRYGVPGAPRRIHELTTPSGARLIEVPPSTVELFGARLPVAGGGYLRLLPGVLTRWAIGRLNRAEAMPAIVYVHPWELDPGQPRIAAPLLTRLRHYTGIRRTSSRLGELMRRFRFGPLRDVIRAHGPAGSAPEPGQDEQQTREHGYGPVQAQG